MKDNILGIIMAVITGIITVGLVLYWIKITLDLV
jgi:hypothetical protein